MKNKTKTARFSAEDEHAVEEGESHNERIRQQQKLANLKKQQEKKQKKRLREEAEHTTTEDQNDTNNKKDASENQQPAVQWIFPRITVKETGVLPRRRTTLYDEVEGSVQDEDEEEERRAKYEWKHFAFEGADPTLLTDDYLSATAREIHAQQTTNRAAKKKKEERTILPTKNANKNPTVSDFVAKAVSEKNVLDGIEKRTVAPLVDPAAEKRLKAAKKPQTAGKAWFDMQGTPLTDEVKQDLLALRLRGELGPGRFGTSTNDKYPKFFQIGTVVEDPREFYSSRIPKKQRKERIIDELLEEEWAKKLKAKHQEKKARFKEEQLAMQKRKEKRKRKSESGGGVKKRGPMPKGDLPSYMKKSKSRK